jgi:hypothetical protein
MGQPGHADALSEAQPLDARANGLNVADDFVSWDDWEPWIGQLAVNDVQVRAADAAGADFYPNLSRRGIPVGDFCPFESGPNLV